MQKKSAKCSSSLLSSNKQSRKAGARSIFLTLGVLVLSAAFLVQTSGQTSQAAPGPQRASKDEALTQKLLVQHQLLTPAERLQHLQPSKHSGLIPEGEFESSKSESPDQQAHRRFREETHKGFYQQPVKDPGFLVRNQPETINLTFVDSVRIDDGSGDTDELPVHESKAIVIGTINSAKAFVSYHRTSVYSDFQILVEQVLKRDLAHPIFPKDIVTGLRTGGSIHFPSGHVTTFVIQGHGFPQVGSHYVFFLTRADQNVPEYSISLAYELSKSGNVLPIDNAIDQQFDGMKTEQFMDRLRQAIAERGDQRQ